MPTDPASPNLTPVRRSGAWLLGLPRRAWTGLQRSLYAAFCGLARRLRGIDQSGDWTGTGP